MTGDALTHQTVSFERPDWHFGFDQIPGRAMDMRIALLGMLAADKVRINGYHLSWPGWAGWRLAKTAEFSISLGPEPGGATERPGARKDPADG